MVHLDGEHPAAECGSSLTFSSSTLIGKVRVARALLQLLHRLRRDVIFVIADDRIQEVLVLEHSLDSAPILANYAHQYLHGFHDFDDQFRRIFQGLELSHVLLGDTSH